jgi:uncharacterized phage protein (TIGR01671 family)
MKQIKFRAWDKEEKVMTIPFSLYECLSGECKIVGEKENWEIMQFTGLHDKNGKEIYVGDIIIEISLLSNRKHIDFIERGRDGFVTHSGGKIGRENRLEVIGNIYQNPELLQ